MKTKASTNKQSASSKTTTLRKLSVVLVALALFTSTAGAASLNSATSVYTVSLTSNGPQFGAVNLPNGKFYPIAQPRP